MRPVSEHVIRRTVLFPVFSEFNYNCIWAYGTGLIDGRNAKERGRRTTIFYIDFAQYIHDPFAQYQTEYTHIYPYKKKKTRAQVGRRVEVYTVVNHAARSIKICNILRPQQLQIEVFFSSKIKFSASPAQDD